MLVLLPLLIFGLFYLTYNTMENNYSVYQHVTPDGLYYFGQTQNVEKRWEANGCHYKGTALQPYIEKYGWDNIQHIVLFRDQTKDNALWIEDFLIETAREDGVCINKQRSGLVSKEEGYKQKYDKEYREQNKDQIKQYYDKNKDQIREKQKQYYDKNKDQIKQYYDKNKDQIREKQKQYYEENKQQIRKKQKQYYKKYYEQNKDRIREYQEQNKDKKREYNRQHYEKNREKRLEYQRQYYQRKKLEKQLKEAVETTLF